MRNSSIPTHVELPTSEQLVRSTFIAIAASAAILVAVVLPAEYGVDPTGIGRSLNLTQMGEIKVQLAQEAEADRVATAQAAGPSSSTATAPAVVGQATPAATEPAGEATAAATGAAERVRSDEMTVTLKPGQGAEVKLTMVEGAKANFNWSVSSGVVNFDLHGDGGGRSISYEKGRAVPSANGVLEAAFDGNHGWYWRNRGTNDVTVTVRTEGAYSQMKRVI